MAFVRHGEPVHPRSVTSTRLGGTDGAAGRAMASSRGRAAGQDPGLRQGMGTGLVPAGSQTPRIKRVLVEGRAPRTLGLHQHHAAVLPIPPQVLPIPPGVLPIPPGILPIPPGLLRPIPAGPFPEKLPLGKSLKLLAWCLSRFWCLHQGRSHR